MMDEANGENGESDQEKETEQSLEEQQSSDETVSDQACCIKELRLAEQEGDNKESSSNQEDDNQDEQKTPQGTENIPNSYQIQFIGDYSLSLFFKQVFVACSCNIT